MKTGVELIADERQRQVSEEGWTAEHDKEHDSGQLALAAACYALGRCAGSETDEKSALFKHWPFSFLWWKPTPDDRIKELVKAGALIAAEIDRLRSNNFPAI